MGFCCTNRTLKTFWILLLTTTPPFLRAHRPIGADGGEKSSPRCACCSVTQSCLTLCNPTDGFPVLHYLPEFAQTHVHWVNDAIQPSHSLLSPSPPALNESSLCIKWSKYWSFSYRPYSFEFANLCIREKWRIEHIDHLPELTWGRLGNVPQQIKLEQIFLIQSQDFGSEDSCPGITSLASPVPVEGS